MSEISDKQFQKLKQLLLHKPCLVCGTPGYSPDRTNYRITTMIDGKTYFRNVIHFVCGNCGHVLSFDSAEQGI